MSDIKALFRIDLNADVGEECGQDAALMQCITSANVACGGHAGTLGTMAETIRLAREHSVSVGAHPGFPDREHFGRREIHLGSGQITELVSRQVDTLARVASQQGIRLQHVKAHGALYNLAVADRRVADAIARGVVAVDPSLILLGMPGSELVLAGNAVGLPTAGEAFADRAYRSDGTLVPRSEPAAVLHDRAEVLARIVSLASRPGVDTICVHGDTPRAAELASNIRATLEAASFVVKSLSSTRFGDERSP